MQILGRLHGLGANLAALFIGICTAGIIATGYFFNFLQPFL